MTTTPIAQIPQRGDIVLVLFPNSDLITAKMRPAVVVQADDLETGIQQIIVAMITSRLFRANHPSRVLIALDSNDGKRSGLITTSVVMTDNLATVTLTLIEDIIGRISTDAVDQALHHTLGI